MHNTVFSKKNLIKIIEKASTITERLSNKFVFNENQISDDIINSRVEQWCQVVAEGNWEQFEKRLSWDNLNISNAYLAVGPVSMSDVQQIPTWAETLNECLQAITLFDFETLEAACWGDDKFPFGEIWLPFIDVAVQKLMAQAGESYKLLSEDAHLSLRYQLWKSLFYVSSPSLELEFSIFCSNRQATATRLKGKWTNNNSKEQYQNFIKDLLAGGLLTFLQEYPVLARSIAIVIEFWVDSTQEFLLRLESDWFNIQKTFQDGKELGEVVAVQPFLSDRHHNGRSVTIITFASGLKVVYKPKNIGIEQAYFQLLEWLNKHQVPLQFKLLKTLNGLDYGWVEFVEALPCQTKEQVKRYYQRCGMQLCLVYVLEATDLHFENIIAHGEDPVIIDLETLMHPQLYEGENLEVAKDAEYLANQQLIHSVLHTGLLPRWQFSSEKQRYDLSGLGAVGQQDTSVRVPKWNNINTDNMILEYEYLKTQAVTNLPFLNAADLALNDYVEDIVEGFQQMYRLLIKHRLMLLAPNSPLTALANQQIRFVFRPTKIYSFISAAALNPKFLRDGAEQSIQLDILSRVMLLSDTKPLFWSILSGEKQALEKMDIPLFTACSNSDDLRITSNQLIKKCFTEPSFNLVLSRLNQLSDENLEQQIKIIRGSLYSRTTNDFHSYSLSEINETCLDVSISLTEQEIVHHAMMIAADLQKQVIGATVGSAIWIAPQFIHEAQCFQLAPTNHSLYDGNCGVALFLAALEKVTGDTQFHHLALNALQPLHKDLSVPSSSLMARKISLGAATGYGSLIYGLVRISQFINEPVLLEDAKRLAFLITPDLIAADKYFDIISGSAGAILGLLALQNSYPDSDVLEQAITCGHHLLANRINNNKGYRTWATLNGQLLTGFSHGAAGIAYALLRLYQATDKAIFLEAACEAIGYENSAFIPESGNWSDFRFSQTGSSYVCSWCHGAPGIGLARVGGLDILNTVEIKRDIEVAVSTTRQQKLSRMDHLCCGNLGLVELLLTAGIKLSQPQLIEVAMKQATAIIIRAKQRGGFGYTPPLSYHPGFFQGAAGIGYELLRLAYPDQLPSVLLWE